MDYCRRAVQYFQTVIIGNEAQSLALFLAMLTAYAEDALEYASVAVLGELASGKTRLVKNILGQHRIRGMSLKDSSGLIPSKHVVHRTSASPTALIYSSELKDFDSPARIIEAGEYQKLVQTPTMIEYLKAQSGDDGTFVYEFTDVTSKSTQTIVQKKRVVVFTYAQVEIDGELASRYIRFAMEENRDITRCCKNLTHGFPSVTYKGYTYTLKSDDELRQELVDQVEFIASSKPIEATNPFYEALTDLEDCSRPSSKRTAQLIESLFKSSARLNFTEREFIGKDDEKTTIKMSAQDLVNVLSLTEIIQAMVLEIDNVDLGILRFLGMRGKAADSSMIINFLPTTGLPELKLVEFERRMKALKNSNYIRTFSDKDDKGKLWYTLNEFKHIHPLTVDWKKAVMVDSSSVVNPITGDRYENLLEFGKVFDEVVRRGLEVNIRADPDHIPTLEEKVESTVKRLITSGARYKQGDENKIMKDCMYETGDHSLNAFEPFKRSIDDLIRREIIEIDPMTLTYMIPDPSFKMNRRTSKRSRMTNVTDLS